ncbi:hypothetical protein ES708_00513 [subsurface metagenome]
MCLAIPMKVIKIMPSDRALVESEGVTMEASLAIVTGVNVGDYVLIHAGFALEIVDVEEAEKTLSLLNEIVMADERSLSDTGNESSEKNS